ncbi:MAG: urease accessory protein UreF [Cellvibrionaceae bacterium]
MSTNSVNTGGLGSAASLLSLLHISSPALPIGAFAYSQGLEYALDSGWCQTSAQVQEWLQENLRHGLGCLDLPVYARCYRAWKTKDFEALVCWNETLLAFRETRELYLEDIQVGGAYRQWHLGQDSNRATLLNVCEKPTVVAMSALAAVLSEIDLPKALLGFAWGWAENQIACASKAMPMGQTDGQKILQQLIPLLVEVCETAQTIEDNEIGTGLMGVALASSWHEHQYSRLFRS